MGPFLGASGYTLVLFFLTALVEPKQSKALTGACCRAQSDWNVVKRGYYAHVLGEADNHFKDPVEALKVLKVRKQLSQLSPEVVLPSLSQDCHMWHASSGHCLPALPRAASSCPRQLACQLQARRAEGA